MIIASLILSLGSTSAHAFNFASCAICTKIAGAVITTIGSPKAPGVGKALDEYDENHDLLALSAADTAYQVEPVYNAASKTWTLAPDPKPRLQPADSFAFDPRGSANFSDQRAYFDPRSGFEAKSMDALKPGLPRFFTIAGTSKSQIADIASDALQGVPQAQSAAFKKLVDDATACVLSGKDATITGHSLGGGLAQAAAYLVDQAIAKAVKQNPKLKPGTLSMVSWNSFGGMELLEGAGIIKAGSTVPTPSYRAVNYRAPGDPVSKLGRHIGDVRELAQPAAIEGSPHPMDHVWALVVANQGLRDAKPMPWMNVIGTVTGDLASRGGDQISELLTKNLGPSRPIPGFIDYPNASNTSSPGI